MELTFVGSGDAFGSGGRLNICFHVWASSSAFLIDCGASVLIALKRLSIHRNAIDVILITHFHADHFSGIAFFVLDAQFSKRTRPLTIIGPIGLRDRYTQVMQAGFPGSSMVRRNFEVSLVELPANLSSTQGVIEVLAKTVVHGHPETQFYGYRIEIDGQVIAYTGDTEWTDSIIELGRGADLLIAEANFLREVRSFPPELQESPRSFVGDCSETRDSYAHE